MCVSELKKLSQIHNINYSAWYLCNNLPLDILSQK
jgi:hypothetical protein